MQKDLASFPILAENVMILYVVNHVHVNMIVKEWISMKYELISKDILDDVCELIEAAKARLAQAHIEDQENMKKLDEIYFAIKRLDEAYNTIQKNRTACNVQPEQP